MKSHFNTRLLCGETRRFTRRARNRQSNAHRMFSRSSLFFLFILSCFLPFLSFFFKIKICPNNFIYVNSLRWWISNYYLQSGFKYNRTINEKNTWFSKIYLSEMLLLYLLSVVYSFRILPSASVIRWYPVHVLQTPVSRGVDHNHNIYIFKNKNARRTWYQAGPNSSDLKSTNQIIFKTMKA